MVDHPVVARLGRICSAWGAVLVAALVAVPAARSEGSFSSRLAYSELRGLPPRPASSLLSSLEVGQILAKVEPSLGPWFVARNGLNKKIRVLESYSRIHAVFLKDNIVYLPNPDGVIDATKPVPGFAVSPALCNDLAGTYTCVNLFEAGLQQQPYDGVLIVGWDVVLAGDVQTDGQSLIVVANRFRAVEHEIDTSPLGFREPPPPGEQPGPQAAGGRSGRTAGDFILFAGDFGGLRVRADGQPGEKGAAGSDAVGSVTKITKISDHTLHPELACEGSVVKAAQSGGDGGKGGGAGNVWVRYALLSGLGSPREPAKTKGLLDLTCAGACGSSFACSHNPALAICDFRREADNATCNDGADNDLDGFTDCIDSDCSKNPFVTACSKDKNLKESSPEACTDLLDDDGDGFVDCKDPSCRLRQICGAGPGQPFAKTTGSEESTDLACRNGVDDDLDGKVDCKDPECRFNPFVQECGGRERTIETCRNGADDDGDGSVDCADPGCAGNPYVLVCNKTKPPFLAESTLASCQDGIDNDGDFFKDCGDYQCLNNPLASPVCGNFENTFEQCRDGQDNDGDKAADCADLNCQLSPFFGELLCEGKQQTKHVRLASAEASYNGVYKESDFGTSTHAGKGAAAGASGKAISATEQMTFENEFCRDCLDEECNFCQIQSVNQTCVIAGSGAAGGAHGDDGTLGGTQVAWFPRRRIDALRALFSPRQWVVGTAQANVLFKRTGQKNLEDAGFLYLHDIVRMHGILTEMAVDCGGAPPAQTASALLHGTVCPAIAADTIRLAYLLDGRNYYGVSPEVALDPHERFEDQHAAFEALFGILSQAVTTWIDLANGLDTSFAAQTSRQAYDDLAAQLAGEIAIAAARENAALSQLAALEQKQAQRALAVTKIQDAIKTNNQAIAKKYNSSGGLGQLILDLGSAFLKAYGGELAKNLGKGAWEELSKTLDGAFDSPGAAPGGGPAGAVSQEKSEDAFDKLWKQVKDAASKGVESEAVKKGASQVLTSLDQLTGTPVERPERSVVVDEISNAILDASQVQITLDYLDLVLDVRKLEAEYQIARMERELLQLRQVMATAASARIEHYQTEVAELRAYDKILLGQETYANAILLVDDLTQRYWRMLRQAEYQVLAYDPDGQSRLHALTKGSYDYNLKNYLDLGISAANVKKAFDEAFRGGASRYFRRLPAAALKPAGAADLAALEAIGLTAVPPFDGGVKPHVVHVRVDYGDLQEDTLLRHKGGVRIDDVRIGFLTSGQPAAPAAVFLARDTLDGFRVKRTQQVDFFADFELVPRRPAGSSVGTPLHYQSLLACTHPPPACDLADPKCVSHLQSLPLSDFSCGLHGKPPGTQPWKENTFYDRSLVGGWLIVVPPDVVKALGKLTGIEVSFAVASRDF